MKIALDAAKGLAFLHGAECPIIYRDFKTSNILLDAVGFLSFQFLLLKFIIYIIWGFDRKLKVEHKQWIHVSSINFNILS